MSSEEQIVEHVVLFKVKPDADPSKVAAWVNGLNGLTSLQLTLHLSAGQLLRCRSSSLTFTHMLHSRYRSKEHLRQYAVHPEHVRLVTQGKSIIDDVMALDWMISNAVAGSVCPKPGSAMRVRFYKLMESLGETEKARVLEVMGGGIENDELSVGESFCDDRAKGYTIASIALFPNANPPAAADLDLNYSGDLLLLKEGVMKDSIQSVVVVDYVIPSP